MRLINTQTLEFEEFIGQDTPPYAILSHTWEDEEVSFQDMSQHPSHARQKKGFAKIQETCRLAARDNIRYAWVDTCCIDKSSSAELTEAINSMYQWYSNAKVCHAYLSDADDSADGSNLAQCRWFSRGWTLQELIAPSKVIFWSRDWIEIGSKASLQRFVHKITGIPTDLLDNPEMTFRYSIARRMSWAATRETTRIEDTAYCLLGLFDVNMPLLYGEGSKAFFRLQEELVRSTTDASLFAWKYSLPLLGDTSAGLLADHPRCFANSTLPPLTNGIHDGMSITNRGIYLRVSLGVYPSASSNQTYVLCLGTIPPLPGSSIPRTVCVYLRQTLPATFYRLLPHLIAMVSPPPKRLSFEPAHLSIRPPSTIPFNLKVHLVRHSRTSVLQIQPLPAGTQRGRVYPVSNFDIHDDLFFSTSYEPDGGGWALFRVKGVFTATSGAKYPLDLLCYVFGWARSTGETRWVLVNRWAETHESLHSLQLDLTTRHFERDGEVIRRMLAKYGGRTSQVVVEPDRREPGGEEADAMVAMLAVEQVNFGYLSLEERRQAPCWRICTKVEVKIVPREESTESAQTLR